ncbi:MAG: DUF3285 domain-containing protein [Pseudanabaena frigida]|uniref:DUF3285 domain-containing protein n=1 Tax=Pseudanabaena frigida TaxID=945775 RepID=A0A2W4YCY9_9CYAN|nr:MAG: DUF3285 domain-containing protein [Pseudanabaena frigida]
MNDNLNHQSNFNQKDSIDAAGKYQTSNASNPKEQNSFVKLAMRNMVKKGSTSLFHLFLTVLGVVGALLGLAIAFH